MLEQRWVILPHYIYVMLQNVRENCVRILENEKHRQLRMSAIIKTVRTPDNITAVAESVPETPSTSIHHRSQQLNISET